MRAIIFAVLALTVFATQSMAFNWVSGGGAKDTRAARVLVQSYVAASVTGTTDETTLATYTLPGGTMGPKGAIRIITLWSYTNSVNNKTFKANFGSVLFLNLVATASTSSLEPLPIIIRNRNSETSQVSRPSVATSSLLSGTVSTITTSSINTAINQTITITGQLANSGETITLEGYTIELLPGN